MQQPIDFTKPQRQSAIVTLIAILQSVQQAWPFLLFFIVSKFLKKEDATPNNQNSTMILLYSSLGVLAVFILVKFNDVIQYFTFRFYIDNGCFIIKKGLFVKTKITIPLQNIQTIQTEQKLLHRLTNTYKINIDTAGTNKAEVSLLAISKPVYHALLQVVEEHATSNTTTTNQQINTQTTYTIRLTDLLKLGISENHIKTFFLIIFFVIGKLQDVKQYLGIDYIDKASNQNITTYNNVHTISIVAAFIMGITLVVSFVMVIFKYANMVIIQKPKGLHIQWGLLSTTQKFIQQQKTQLLIWHTNFLRQLFGLHTMRLYATDENEALQKTHIQLAITNKNILQNVLLFYLPNYCNNNQFIKPNKKIISRNIVIIALPIFCVAGAITMYFFKWYALLWLLWFCYYIVARNIHYYKYKIWLQPQYVQIQKGIWGKENIVLKYQNVQFVSIKTTPYKRSKNLADIVLYTAGKNITIPFMEQATANSIANYIIAFTEGYRNKEIAVEV